MHRSRRLKHAGDRVVAGLLLLTAAPVMAVVALMIRMTSGGPVLYRQERVGQHGQVFTILKFRTMVVGADRHLAPLLKSRHLGDEPLFKIPDDPRVTRVGRVLRRASLDELPQLVNVVRGEMSLVGPRPQRPAEVELYEPAHFRRLAVRPGLTGLWQVSGRSELDWPRAVELDLKYVDEWSLALDVLILVKTFPAVVRSRGAV